MRCFLNYSDGKPAELLNVYGGKIATNDYNEINEFINGYALCEKDSKFGFIDVNGNEIVAPEFDYLTAVEQGVAFGVKGDETFRIAFKETPHNYCF